MNFQCNGGTNALMTIGPTGIINIPNYITTNTIACTGGFTGSSVYCRSFRILDNSNNISFNVNPDGSANANNITANYLQAYSNGITTTGGITGLNGFFGNMVLSATLSVGLGITGASLTTSGNITSGGNLYAQGAKGTTFAIKGVVMGYDVGNTGNV
ncbi:MAG: hypothetical protein EBX41_09640, partial [Chitinophagia bacterium]|nr:hypothetical protein [Chitinophagia bacterium]